MENLELLTLEIGLLIVLAFFVFSIIYILCFLFVFVRTEIDYRVFVRKLRKDKERRDNLNADSWDRIKQQINN